MFVTTEPPDTRTDMCSRIIILKNSPEKLHQAKRVPAEECQVNTRPLQGQV